MLQDVAYAAVNAIYKDLVIPGRVQELSIYCNRDMVPFSNTVTNLHEVVTTISTSLNSTLDLLGCDRIVPIYTKTIYDGLCGTNMVAMVWMFAGALIIGFLGMIMVTTRAAYKHTIYRPVEVLPGEDDSEFEHDADKDMDLLFMGNTVNSNGSERLAINSRGSGNHVANGRDTDVEDYFDDDDEEDTPFRSGELSSLSDHRHSKKLAAQMPGGKIAKKPTSKSKSLGTTTSKTTAKSVATSKKSSNNKEKKSAIIDKKSISSGMKSTGSGIKSADSGERKSLKESLLEAMQRVENNRKNRVKAAPRRRSHDSPGDSSSDDSSTSSDDRRLS